MHVEVKKFNTKKETYKYLNEQLVLQVKDIKNDVANMANASSLIYLLLDDLNWSGFYLMKDGALALGPFQGKPAVVDIAVGAGVCGTCVAEGKTQVVKDVHSCCNHIACDISSASEIVVPMYKNGELVGVLDIDSPIPERFDEEDQAGLEEFVDILMQYIF
ncbi:MAG: GAF domain-containing protein [Firmicutes bacterium]|jgi:GAF domain-containing protein|nr:GAF domain-containing protein [Bacillota bacterium]MBQ2271344.1 GAF domain-containing protein [Bacillota bacterium]MBQ5796594.1 GAF domain-containing protein [Bacillota bacterium]MBQ6948538.1 GAF domain-containing protein [Bacillota bacterium]